MQTSTHDRDAALIIRPCARKVVTYRAPNGRSIDICPTCADRLTAGDEWPRNPSGEYCQVSHGLHRGVCCYAVSE